MNREKLISQTINEYWIYLPNGYVYQQRKRVFSATDNPMTTTEEIILFLCQALDECVSRAEIEDMKRCLKNAYEHIQYEDYNDALSSICECQEVLK